jgi:hypothetical protein
MQIGTEMVPLLFFSFFSFSISGRRDNSSVCLMFKINIIYFIQSIIIV